MKVVKEMLEERQLQLNRQVWSLMVRYHIVGRNADGVLAAIDAMEAEGHLPSLELLEAAIARLEREGHAQGMQKLMIRTGKNSWQTYAARNKVLCNAQPSGSVMARWLTALGWTSFPITPPKGCLSFKLPRIAKQLTILSDDAAGTTMCR